jgi:hypothetical protein
MDDFYAKLKCWRDYNAKRDAQLRDIRDSANKIVENNQSQKKLDSVVPGGPDNKSTSKKRPTTAVVAGAKNLRSL